MLFVMYGTNGSVPVRTAKVRKVADHNDQVETIVDRPLFMADFRPGVMTELQRQIAVTEFKRRNPKSPFGATPYAEDNVMGTEYATEDTMPNSQYTGFDPAFSISRFDTREDIPYEEQGAFTDEEKAELKEFTERVLLEKMKFGGFFRLDDSLPKPWANYPDENGPGVAQKIIATAREIGMPLETVIEYERYSESPKQGVISMATAELEKVRVEAFEAKALSAQIPA